MTASATGSDRSENSGRKRQRADGRPQAGANTRTNRRVRSSSGERAYERKRERGRRSSEGAPSSGEAKRSKGRGVDARSREPSAREVLLGSGALRSGREAFRALTNTIATSRVPFVGTVVVVLVTGIVATLWLSIAAVGNSYRMQESKQRVQALSERKEDLLRSVSRMSSIPEIRRRAVEMNMVPVSEVARLVPQPDGSVRVVGEPRPAEAPPDERDTGPPEGENGGNGQEQRSNQPPPEHGSESSADPDRPESNEPSVG
ncbi:hypothetical protein SAMN04487905_104150 [Actinopolyspora xinjiangensis]|uniref:Cell division protein FtsL n=1 Tax=Actinopolyspora xinjiangensis TaxID=405564 RepID=A0A1H0SSV5_9ACTN|nr:hypothetical protein [Actinopolyspora xinjiangensis]SDP44793.1 hypothetical protein SAMN04487905_104150 [Actinopolyspora xinjiangensis]